MKRHFLAGLVVASAIIAVQPAAAAPGETPTVQTGTFAGARIRFSLGGKQQAGKFRAGLMVAPTLRSQTILGVARTRFGEGLELSFTGDRPLTFSLAGRPVSQLLPGGTRSEENKLGLSTGGKVAIGVGVALVVGAAVVYSAAEERDRLSD